eukprot:ctg_597.g287
MRSVRSRSNTATYGSGGSSDLPRFSLPLLTSPVSSAPRACIRHPARRTLAPDTRRPPHRCTNPPVGDRRNPAEFTNAMLPQSITAPSRSGDVVVLVGADRLQSNRCCRGAPRAMTNRHPARASRTSRFARVCTHADGRRICHVIARIPANRTARGSDRAHACDGRADAGDASGSARKTFAVRAC